MTVKIEPTRITQTELATTNRHRFLECAEIPLTKAVIPIINVTIDDIKNADCFQCAEYIPPPIRRAGANKNII
jgi:hypothetical protein